MEEAMQWMYAMDVYLVSVILIAQFFLAKRPIRMQRLKWHIMNHDHEENSSQSNGNEEGRLAENTNNDSCEVEATIPSPFLPHHLLVEILSKVPVKSLLRFRCTSKSWRSLISDSHFIKTHLNQSLKNSNSQTQKIFIATSYSPFGLFTAIFGSTSNDIVVEKVDFLFQNHPHPRPRPQCEIIGSCNGLICLKVDSHFIYVFNLSTRESKQIPNKEYLSNVVGFGYDRCSDDYKLVKITSKCIYVYSLRISSWKKVYFPGHRVHVIGHVMQLNGAFHWLCFGDISDYTSLEIAAFSLADEKLRKIPLPTSFTDFDDARTLPVFEGCLCIQPLNDDAIWVMKEYGVDQSWTKLDTKISFLNTLETLGLLRNGEAMLLIDQTRFVLFNTIVRTYRDVVIPDIGEAKNDVVIPDIREIKNFHATMYVDSLQSPGYRQTNEI